MLAWLWDVFVGRFCVHKWIIIRRGPRVCDGDTRGYYYDSQCDRCGRIKEFKT